MTSSPQSIKGDLSFRTTKPNVDGGILLGARLANRLSVYPGDVVTLVPVTQAKMNPALGVAVPRFWRFEVTGLFDTGMFQYDNQFVVLKLDVAQRFTGLGDAVSGSPSGGRSRPCAGDRGSDREGAGLPVPLTRLADPERQPLQRPPAREAGHGADYLLHHGGGRVQHRGHPHHGRGHKTREIGILRAMGLTSPAVARIFLLQGAVIGGVGTAVGLVAGLALANLVDKSGWIRINPAVYFIDHLPVHIEARDVMVVVLASLAIAVLATIYPSRTAAGLTPVDAIRHE